MPPLVGQVHGRWLGVPTRDYNPAVDVSVSSAVMICDEYSGCRSQRRSRPRPMIRRLYEDVRARLRFLVLGGSDKPRTKFRTFPIAETLLNLSVNKPCLFFTI